MSDILINLALLALAIPATGAALYLLVLTLLSQRLPAPLPSQRRRRFDIVVPAHNEATVILRTIAGLKAIDWPDDQFVRFTHMAREGSTSFFRRLDRFSVACAVRSPGFSRKGWAIEHSA